jgi:hypothetical protein
MKIAKMVIISLLFINSISCGPRDAIQCTPNIVSYKFEDFDKNRDNKISVEEFGQLTNFSVKSTPSQVSITFSIADTNNDNFIVRTEFNKFTQGSNLYSYDSNNCQ